MSSWAWKNITTENNNKLLLSSIPMISACYSKQEALRCKYKTRYSQTQRSKTPFLSHFCLIRIQPACLHNRILNQEVPEEVSVDKIQHDGGA